MSYVVYLEPKELLPFPLADPKTQVGKEAAKLYAEQADLFRQFDEVEGEQERIQRELVESEQALDSVLKKAASSGKVKTTKAVANAEADYAKAKEAATTPWGRRKAVVANLANEKRREYEQFVDSNFTELLEELAPAADESVAAILKDAEQLLDSLDGWYACQRAHHCFAEYARGVFPDRDLVNPGSLVEQLKAAVDALVSAQTQQTLDHVDGIRSKGTVTNLYSPLVSPAIDREVVDKNRVINGKQPLHVVDGDGEAGADPDAGIPTQGISAHYADGRYRVDEVEVDGEGEEPSAGHPETEIEEGV